MVNSDHQFQRIRLSFPLPWQPVFYIYHINYFERGPCPNHLCKVQMKLSHLAQWYRTGCSLKIENVLLRKDSEKRKHCLLMQCSQGQTGFWRTSVVNESLLEVIVISLKPDLCIRRRWDHLNKTIGKLYTLKSIFAIRVLIKKLIFLV